MASYDHPGLKKQPSFTQNFLFGISAAIVAGVIFALMFVGGAVQPKHERAITIFEGREAAIATLERKLFEPKVEELAIRKQGTIVCGVVDSKNQFGVWQGKQRFIWAKNNIAIVWPSVFGNRQDVIKYRLIVSSDFVVDLRPEYNFSHVFTKAWQDYCLGD